ncbi:MAG TPA: GrpB family protein [Acidimicrobiales bacterium]|nr:GrpB family protein [Acidimicrobiales bacterium]
MLVVSTPSEVLRDALVKFGAVAHSKVPKWEPLNDSITVVIGADPADVHLSVGLDCEVEALETLWFERILPFEANLRAGQRAPRRQRPVLARPDPTWPDQAERLIARLCTATGSSVRRIDHIGSTSIPGLVAKDIIDIQVVVDDLVAALELARNVGRVGFVHVEGDWFGEDRDGVEFQEVVAVNADPGRSVNVNFRSFTDPVWKETLLFRDFLRGSSSERHGYAEMKRALESQDLDVDRYGELKMPYIRAALREADTTP